MVIFQHNIFLLNEAHELAEQRLAPSLWTTTSTTMSHADIPLTGYEPSLALRVEQRSIGCAK